VAGGSYDVAISPHAVDDHVGKAVSLSRYRAATAACIGCITIKDQIGFIKNPKGLEEFCCDTVVMGSGDNLATFASGLIRIAFAPDC